MVEVKTRIILALIVAHPLTVRMDVRRFGMPGLIRTRAMLRRRGSRTHGSRTVGRWTLRHSASAPFLSFMLRRQWKTRNCKCE
jgi:hypothetical protein